MSRRSQRNRGRNRKSNQLRLETLETRQLMTANLQLDPPQQGGTVVDVHVHVDDLIPSEIEFIESTGVVEVQGDDGHNHVTVEDHEFPINHIHYGQPGIRVTMDNDGAGPHEVSETLRAAEVTKVVFHGEDGSDSFINDTEIASEAFGGPGSDTLIGGSGDDLLKGGHDPDTIEGNGGSDTIYGGPGDDLLLSGGAKQDDIFGGDGDDVIDGGAGDDYLQGGDGADTVYGGKGNDELYGDPEDTSNGGADTLEGGEGDDELYGGPKGDTLKGNEGNDDLWGDAGPDLIKGGKGEDEAWGGQGADVIEGGEDDDVLRGGDGPDGIYGGGGEDQLFGGQGDDGLWGGGREDELTGGDGDDRFLMYDGKDGDDVITTLTDNDVVVEFEDSSGDKVKGVTYGAASWNYDDILAVDAAFAQMVRRTGNNTLLMRKSGKELTFHRVGAPLDAEPGDFLAGGWNSDNGNITLTESTLSGGDEWIHQVVYHEVAHNWDDENDDWGEWKDISGWSQGFLGLGPWSHDGTQEFARDYGEVKPHEDFATSFAAVFMFDAAETYSGTGAINSLDDIEEKADFVNDFLDSLGADSRSAASSVAAPPTAQLELTEPADEGVGAHQQQAVGGWTGPQGQIPVRRVAEAGASGVGLETTSYYVGSGLLRSPALEEDVADVLRAPTGRQGVGSDDAEVSSFANKKRSTDELDPLGTSEESGSGEIIIYRDRNGEIEGTSETHEEPQEQPLPNPK